MNTHTSLHIALLLITLPTLLHAETTDYAYDAAGRLDQADYSTGARIAYAYDANGNLLTRQTTRPAGTNYVISTIWSAGGHITPTNPVVAAGANQTLSIIASNFFHWFTSNFLQLHGTHIFFHGDPITFSTEEAPLLSVHDPDPPTLTRTLFHREHDDGIIILSPIFLSISS